MSPTLLYMCWKLGPMAMTVIKFIEISLVMTSLMLFLHICVYNSSSWMLRNSDFVRTLSFIPGLWRCLLNSCKTRIYLSFVKTVRRPLATAYHWGPICYDRSKEFSNTIFCCTTFSRTLSLQKQVNFAKCNWNSTPLLGIDICNVVKPEGENRPILWYLCSFICILFEHNNYRTMAQQVRFLCNDQTSIRTIWG